MENMLEEKLAERASKKEKLVEKWNSIGLLDKLTDDPSEQQDIALLATHQQSVCNDAVERRFLLPLCFNVWKKLAVIRDIACIQPVFAREDSVFYLGRDEGKTFMGEIGVNTKPRRMKCQWSVESTQNVVTNGISAETEILSLIAHEASIEINRRVVNFMAEAATTKMSWDFNTALGDTIMEKYEALYVRSVEASNSIKEKTGRGVANWIVTSPEVASIFETATAGFEPVTSDTFTNSLGINYVGTINKRWKIYKDSLFPPSKILMGYKGNHPYDSGAIYAPHVMFTPTPVTLDMDSFVPRKGLTTDSDLVTQPNGGDYYATIEITNFII